MDNNILAYSNASPQPGMAKSYYKTDNQRFNAAWHAAHCRDKNCEYCQFLCEDGLIISCDRCSNVHHTDWLGWSGKVDSEGRVFVLCPECESAQHGQLMLDIFGIQLCKTLQKFTTTYI